MTCCNPVLAGTYKKDKVDVRDVYIYWAEVIDEGDELLSATWEIEGGDGTLYVVETDYTQVLGDLDISRVRLAGGTPGQVYYAYCTVRTAHGEVARRALRITCHDVPGLQADDRIRMGGHQRGEHTATTAGDAVVVPRAGNTGEHSASTTLTIEILADADNAGAHSASSDGGIFDPFIIASNTGRHACLSIPYIQSSADGNNVGRHTATTNGTVLGEFIAANNTGRHACLSIPYLTTVADAANSGSHAASATATVDVPSVPVLAAAWNQTSHAAATDGTVIDPNPQPPPVEQPWVGYSLDPTTYRTVFRPGNVHQIAASQTQFANMLATIDANPNSFDELWLYDGVEYDWPGPRTLAGGGAFNRTNPQTNPFVIRTVPGASNRAVLNNLYMLPRAPVNGLVFADLHLNKYDDVVTLRFDQGASHVLFENCVAWFDVQSGNTYPGVDVTKYLDNFCLRFCIIHGFGFVGSTSRYSNIFNVNVKLNMEYCVQSHGGWPVYLADGVTLTTRSNLPRINGGPDIFKHGHYYDKRQPDVTPGYFRFNVIANASSHGIHMRDGGIAHDNLFIRNPLNQIGYASDGKYVYGHSHGHIYNNVYLQGEDINIADSQIRGQGLVIEQCNDLIVEDNIFAFNESVSPTNSTVFKFTNPTYPPDNTVIVRNNKSYQWSTSPITWTPGMDISGAQIYGNRLDDGAVFKNPNNTYSKYNWETIGPSLIANGFTRDWILATLAEIRDDFTIIG